MDPMYGTPSEEPAKDVLAAEAFAVPAPDPALRHGPIMLPEDPTGIPEPHDVLAAEEFAIPATGPRAASTRLTSAFKMARHADPPWRLALGALAALIALRLLRRR